MLLIRGAVAEQDRDSSADHRLSGQRERWVPDYYPSMGARGIVFFDIDGTLVPSMSSSSFLAQRFGHALALDAAEQRYAEGELTNEEVSVIDAEGWRGNPTSTVAAWLEELPLIAGIDEVVAWCVEHDVEPVLASLAWQPVAEAIARRHGFIANGGPRVHVVGTDYDGTVAEHFNEYDKRDRALQLAAERDVSIDHCCAIGDSRSDLPLFDALPASLALNASAAARVSASAAVDTADLRDVIPWLEAWEATLH